MSWGKAPQMGAGHVDTRVIPLEQSYKQRATWSMLATSMLYRHRIDVQEPCQAQQQSCVWCHTAVARTRRMTPELKFCDGVWACTDSLD